jgi:hypothetical protein
MNSSLCVYLLSYQSLFDQYILACDSGVMFFHVHIPHLLDQSSKYILASDSGVMCLHVHIPHLLDQSSIHSNF